MSIDKLSLIGSNNSNSNGTNITEARCRYPSPWPYTCYTVPAATVIIVIGLALMLVIIFGNLLVIVAVVRDTKLKKMRQNWLIVSLALADLLVGVLVMPFTLTYEIIGVWVMGVVLCELWLALDVLFVTASILNLCAISIDRLLCLTYPLRYPKQRTKVKMSLICSTAWFLSFAICFPPLVGWRPKRREGECFLSTQVGYVLYSALGSFYLPVFVLGFVYAKIFAIIKKRSQQRLKEATAKQAALLASQNTTLNAHRPRETALFLSAIAFGKNSTAQSPSPRGSEDTEPFLPKEDDIELAHIGMQDNYEFSNHSKPRNINEESEEETTSSHLDVTKPRRSVSYNDGILSPIISDASSDSLNRPPGSSFVSSGSEFCTAFSSNSSLQCEDHFMDCRTERSLTASPSLYTALEEFTILSGDPYQLRRLSSRKHSGSLRKQDQKRTASKKNQRKLSALSTENGHIPCKMAHDHNEASHSPTSNYRTKADSTTAFLHKTTPIIENDESNETPSEERKRPLGNGILSHGLSSTSSSPIKKLSFQVNKERAPKTNRQKEIKKESKFSFRSPIRNLRKKRNRALSCPKVTFCNDNGSPKINVPSGRNGTQRPTGRVESVQEERGRLINQLKSLPSRFSVQRSSRFSISMFIDDSRLQSRKSSFTSVTIAERTPQEQIESRLRLLKAKDRKAAFSLGMILGSFIACWLPFFVLYVLTTVRVLAPEGVFDICFWLGYCNSALNPLIYACLNKDFRNAFRKVLGIHTRRRK